MADEKSKDVAAAAATSAQPVTSAVGTKDDTEAKVQSATQPKKREPVDTDYPDTYPPKVGKAVHSYKTIYQTQMCAAARRETARHR